MLSQSGRMASSLEISTSSGQQQKGIFSDFAFGVISGATSKIITTPFFKASIQMMRDHRKTESIGISPLLNYMKTIFEMIESQGFLSLWRNQFTLIFRYSLIHGRIFALKDFFHRNILKNVNFQLQKVAFLNKCLLSGGLTGFINSLLCYPIYNINRQYLNQIKIHQRNSTSLLKFAQALSKKEGILGFYKLFSVENLSSVVYRAFYFGLYDSGKAFLWGRHHQEVLFLDRFVLAFVVVSCSLFVSQPFEKVRKTIMLESFRPKEDRKFLNSFDFVKKMYRKSGAGFFFISSNNNFLVKVGSSLVLVLYDEVQIQYARIGNNDSITW